MSSGFHGVSDVILVHYGGGQMLTNILKINLVFRMFLDLQKSCEDGAESSHTTLSPIINILHCCD